uniref:Phosphodiesterase n=1 Tax=Anser brachyrhynchus TaxID=132585 RepID=A0A8B9CNL7_9AVES
MHGEGMEGGGGRHNLRGRRHPSSTPPGLTRCLLAVLIIPLVDKDSGAVVCVILVHCGHLSDSDEQNLRALERHTLVAYRRVQALQKLQPWPQVSLSTSSSQTSLAKAEKAPDSSYSELDCKILQLCGELYDLDAASLQLKVINYVSTNTHCSHTPHCMHTCHTHAHCCVSMHPVVQCTLLCAQTLLHAQHLLQTEQRPPPPPPPLLHTWLGGSSPWSGGSLPADLPRGHPPPGPPVTLPPAADDVSVLLQEIITEARNLSNAEICSVFLLDRLSHELVAKVFDGGVVDDESYEIRIPADQGIAGHVATTGKILNIKDAYSHPLFYRGVDDSTGFRTRNILCFPIKNESQEVIGVAELVNKINGPWFSKFDEDLATAFSIYCGISIAHSLLYKKVNEAQYRSHLANEMMMYHMKVSDDEYTKLLSEGIQPVATIDPNFASFTYTPRSLPEDDTSMAILSMLQDMNFINTYKMDRQTLTRFCLMVKKGYRDPPYHNWMHAFSVSHFCYLLYKNLELVNYLEDIEIFALFISCMCHDLDHRGTNNSFQVASVSSGTALGGEGHGDTAGWGWGAHPMVKMGACSELGRPGLGLGAGAGLDLGEKAMGNRPLEMMDREKAYIPELQISFMEHIAMPIYKLLQDLFPKASELYERVASNREQWTKVSHKFTIRGLPSNNSLDFLDEEYDPQAPHGPSGPRGPP